MFLHKINKTFQNAIDFHMKLVYNESEIELHQCSLYDIELHLSIGKQEKCEISFHKIIQER